MKLSAVVRFLVVSATAFALASFATPIVLAPAAWLTWLLAIPFGFTAAPPLIAGPAIFYGGPLQLEDPYLLAGVPLFLGLWAAPVRPLTAVPWARVLIGLAVLEAVGGITIALVAATIARGFIESPAREPLELVALVFVSAIRILPLPLWMLLDRAWRNFLAK